MSSIEIATLKARVEFLEKQNEELNTQCDELFEEKESLCSFTEVNEKLEKAEMKYRKFKNVMSSYLHDTIIEPLGYDEDATRSELVEVIDGVTREWEEEFDEFIEEFDEFWS